MITNPQNEKPRISPGLFQFLCTIPYQQFRGHQ
jgi:hypothetical protein